MSFFTISGAASGDIFSGMMTDRMLESDKKPETKKAVDKSAATQVAVPAKAVALEPGSAQAEFEAWRARQEKYPRQWDK